MSSERTARACDGAQTSCMATAGPNDTDDQYITGEPLTTKFRELPNTEVCEASLAVSVSSAFCSYTVYAADQALVAVE